MIEVQWLDAPEGHDYDAARSYLSLVFDEASAGAFVAQLRQAPGTSFKAKDIFRASGLSLLGPENYHVAKDLKKIDAGKKVSPLLLVRCAPLGKVVIADGYHRMCAVYRFDEDALVPCRIV
jgi:hypothetical protein